MKWAGYHTFSLKFSFKLDLRVFISTNFVKFTLKILTIQEVDRIVLIISKKFSTLSKIESFRLSLWCS